MTAPAPDLAPAHDLEPAARYVIAETLLLVLAEGVTQEHFDQAMRRTQAMAGAS